PPAKAGGNAGWTIPFNYQPVHECLRELHLGPYKHLEEITFTEVLMKYGYWFFSAVAVLFIMVIAIGYITRLNHRLRLSKIRLKRAHDGLERRVKNRTAKLRVVNEQLEQEINNRKRVEEELRGHRRHLEELVEERTAELSVAKKRAEDADRIKSAFLATMSHELRTPLNSIIGFTGILLQGIAGPMNDEQSKQLRMVRSSARYLLGLINDLMDISMIEAGRLEIVSKPFDMREAIEEAIQTVTPLVREKGLTLNTEIAPEVGEITSDRRRVEQILINLLNNAVKFTDSGLVRAECQVSDGHLLTRVVDTGTGIKPENIGKLFEPFQKISTRLTRAKEGTGLGLSICKKLVEILGGEIEVRSEWGKGSTFTFTLPIKTPG
ncbi:MAG: hypothetical protein JRC99_13140, partial [Deltaproteobacteria bacterium]|nr:hypothetical protein [Deltaproteobacteria bacterium]